MGFIHKFVSRLGIHCPAGRLVVNTQSFCTRYSQSCQSSTAGKSGGEYEARLPICSDVSVYASGAGVQVTWASGEKSRFHSKWLRHFCQCPSCHQAHSGQRTLNTSKLSPTSKVLSAHTTDEGNIALEWEHENDHLGLLSLKWLRENCYSQSAREHRRVQRLPITYTEDGLPQVQFDEIMTPQGHWRFAKQIGDYGVSLVKNVPSEGLIVKKIANRLGPVLYTIYGETFDVVSTAQPINIAYSTAELPFHMDLLYYESPPGIQLLHVLKFDYLVKGGDSVFLDVFPVAEEFRRRFPDEFEILVRVPATFQKIHFTRDEPVYMKYQRPHIILNHEREIVCVNWSPAFEGPLSIAEEDVEPYFDAYYKFETLANESPLKKTLRLEEGDCVAFNNRRVLHGRLAFESNSGTRHLQGCYVNIDEFKRSLAVLSQTVGDCSPCRRTGNQCFF